MQHQYAHSYAFDNTLQYFTQNVTHYTRFSENLFPIYKN